MSSDTSPQVSSPLLHWHQPNTHPAAVLPPLLGSCRRSDPHPGFSAFYTVTTSLKQGGVKSDYVRTRWDKRNKNGSETQLCTYKLKSSRNQVNQRQVLTCPPLLLVFSQSMDLSQSALQVSQPSANTGGMISSAAASVTSWFRAYTGQRWCRRTEPDLLTWSSLDSWRSWTLASFEAEWTWGQRSDWQVRGQQVNEIHRSQSHEAEWHTNRFLSDVSELPHAKTVNRC